MEITNTCAFKSSVLKKMHSCHNHVVSVSKTRCSSEGGAAGTKRGWRGHQEPPARAGTLGQSLGLKGPGTSSWPPGVYLWGEPALSLSTWPCTLLSIGDSGFNVERTRPVYAVQRKEKC